MKTAALLLAVALTSAGSADSLRVEIDVLPGETQNLVDPEASDAVTVALLASETLDARSIVPLSLRLAGAAIVKDATGATHRLEDVNGDGRLDLVVRFAARELLLADADREIVLEGKTADGTAIAGGDAVLTVAAARRAADPPGARLDEKLPPLVAALQAKPLAILGSADLDVREVLLDSMRVNGRPLTKRSDGSLVAYEDVDGDGREDISIASLGEADSLQLSAATVTGRLLQSPGNSAVVLESNPAPPGTVSVHATSPYVIGIPQQGSANPYPSTIHVSGMSGVVSKLRVSISAILHTCFNDLDILLVAPDGRSVVLMSDVGSCFTPLDATYLIFDDYAPAGIGPGTHPSSSATLRVSNFGEGDFFPAPAPSPSGAMALSAFNGVNPNGDWKLFVYDDAAGDQGQIRDGWSLDIVTSTRVCNTTPLAIPDGTASPYPSTITLSGLPEIEGKVSVTLNGLTHARPDDLDVLLVNPSNQRIMLMSDAGGSTPVADLQLTFDDDVAAVLPDAGAISASAAFRVTDHDPGELLPPPAPNAPASRTLAGLRGENPNGVWQLFVADDTAAATGALAGGWCLDITSLAPQESCSPLALTVPDGAPGVTAGPASFYPWTVDVNGTSGTVGSVEVRLLGLSHTYPDDLDVYLQAPSGKTIPVFSDAGGSTDVAGLDLRLQSDAFFRVPDEAPFGPGPYKFSDYEPDDLLPAGGPAPPFDAALLDEPPNGQWSLWVADDAGADWGTIAGGFCLSLNVYGPFMSFCSDDPMLIPEGTPDQTSGNAWPYPWGISVRQQGTITRKVRLRIEGLSHTYPDDLDILLVGPGGRATWIVSDAGGGEDLIQSTLVFDDEGSTPPDTFPLGNGTFHPSNFDGGDADLIPAPAPPGGFGASLSIFEGIDPQGAWELFVRDDAGFDVGSAARWCLDLFPVYPSSEATDLRFTSKTSLGWSVAANATGYLLLRGTPADLPALLSAAPDACVVLGGTAQAASGLDLTPSPGSFFWYLVVAESGYARGPAGDARLAGLPSPRSAESSGACIAP